MTEINPNIVIDDDDNDEECVEKELPYLFEKELIERQNKYIRHVKQFIPIYNVAPISDKFYAQHEQKKPNYDMYLKHLLEDKNGRSRWTTNGAPRLQSQLHGYPHKHLTAKVLHKLNFVNAPKQRCPLTIFGEQLICNRITERPEFNGLRFFVR